MMSDNNHDLKCNTNRQKARLIADRNGGGVRLQIGTHRSVRSNWPPDAKADADYEWNSIDLTPHATQKLFELLKP